MHNEVSVPVATTTLALTFVVALGCSSGANRENQGAGGISSGGSTFSSGDAGGISGGSMSGGTVGTGGAASGGSMSGGTVGTGGVASGGSMSGGRLGTGGIASGGSMSGGRVGTGGAGIGGTGGAGGGGKGGTGPAGAADAAGPDAAGDAGPVAYDFVLTAFTNQSESNMYVYRSADGLAFNLLKGPAYTPPGAQLVRDPSVILRDDGRYYLAYTTGWREKNFGIAHSTDLVTWTFLTTVPTLANATSSWAPEWFVEDGTVHVIISISTTGDGSAFGNFTPHLFTATSTDLTKWDGGVRMTGIEPNYIDTFVVRSGATYHAFTKNENTKIIEHATGSTLGGPYTLVGKGDWAGWGATNVEGPCLFQLANGTWRMLVDGYTSGQYLYSDSQDLVSWSKRQTIPGGLSGFIRHGTVLRRVVERRDAGP